MIDNNIKYFFIFLFISFHYLLYSIEYEVSGVLYVDTYQYSFHSEFSARVKNEKWFLSYRYINPSFCIANIESGYDGYLNYCLFHQFIPSNAFRKIKMTTNVVETVGTINRLSFYHNSIYDGGDIIWLTFCSRSYISSISNGLINPFFDKYGISSKTKIPAVVRLNNYIIECLSYNYMNSTIMYDVLEYTNINNTIIPLKARAVNATIYSNNMGNVIYNTGAVFYVEAKNIIPECLNTDFHPKLNTKIYCYDSRYDEHPYLPTNIIYSCTNWLSDYELTNSTFFKQEYKRILDFKKQTARYENKLTIAKIVFIIIIIITLIPSLFLFIKLKLNTKKNS